MDIICTSLYNQIGDISIPVFIGSIPPEKKEGLGLNYYNNVNSKFSIGEENSSTIDYPVIKCIFKTIEYQTGSNALEQVRKKLSKFKDLDNNIYSVLPVNSGSYLGVNDNQLHEFKITFKLITQEV